MASVGLGIEAMTVGDLFSGIRLKALGNSVVPQIPEILGRMIMEIEGRDNGNNGNKPQTGGGGPCTHEQTMK